MGRRAGHASDPRLDKLSEIARRLFAEQNVKGVAMSRKVRDVLAGLTLPVRLVVLARAECAVGGNSDSAESSGDRVLEEILSTWKARANSIQTLRIRARFYPRGPD